MITCTFENGDKGSLRHVTIDGLVIENDKILLVKRAVRFSNGGKYASPGGFLGRDENAKDGVLREVLEETGYKIEIESLFAVTDKPDRKGEDRQNVNFTFLARPLKKIKDPDNEVSEVTWFDLDKLPNENEFAFDHYDRIKLYLRYRKEKFNLPVLES